MSVLHKKHIDLNHSQFSNDEKKKIQVSLKSAELERDKICISKNCRKEGLGKAPAFYPVLFYILDLVPETYPRREYFLSLFLFMMNTGQRYVTICNIKLCDIVSINRSGDNMIVSFIARITKANNDWNQKFNIEGNLHDNRIMNFVYFLNQFLIKEHNLNLDNFDEWKRDDITLIYLWGNHSSKFKKKISYSSVYLTWRYFHEQAGIPPKLLGLHSFRSGFYCQSLLNATIKGLDYNVMNDLSQLLAGWRRKRDRATYNKIEMVALTTNHGPVKNPTPEQMLGCDFDFISKWEETKN
jgi:hypothetical protein